MNQLAKLPTNNTEDHKEFLRNRFFYIKETSGQKHFWDSVTGDSNLTAMHLNPHLLARGVGWDEAQKIVKLMHWYPIILSDLYRPGQPPVVKWQGNYYPNLWREPDVKPVEADPSPFTDHLTKMLGSKEKADYLIRALAYRYQTDKHGADKPHVSFYFYGAEGGMGKSLFTDTLEKVFGESAVMSITDEQALKSLSAVDVWKRTWTVVQEVNVKKGSTDYNGIKTMTGGRAFAAARKGEHFKKHETPAQLIMLSNHAPHFLEPNDRRFFVSRWQAEFEDAETKNAYFNKYIDWLRDGGYEAIAHLLNTTDISDFDVAAPAMMTPEKVAVVNMLMDECVEEIRAYIEERPAKVLFTADDFSSIFVDHRVDDKAIKYKLEAAGLTKQNTVRFKDRSGRYKRHYFWAREGWSVVTRKGQAPLIRNPAGEVSALDPILHVDDAL